MVNFMLHIYFTTQNYEECSKNAGRIGGIYLQIERKYRLSIPNFKSEIQNNPKSKLLSTNMMPQVENSTSDFMCWVTVRIQVHYKYHTG